MQRFECMSNIFVLTCDSFQERLRIIYNVNHRLIEVRVSSSVSNNDKLIII